MSHACHMWLHVASRKLYDDGNTCGGDNKQALANLSSAKLSLQGVMTKAKVTIDLEYEHMCTH